ncbi:MAG: methyltransferase type 12 [uncultured bacterium]|nr:MAG: methyltransferase type 12 [uncultured bacterium]
MTIKTFLKIPLVLIENILFSLFPKFREIIEKYIYNPYQFNDKHLEYSKKQFDDFLQKVGGINSIKDKVLLELGPGGSIGFGILALKNGARKYYAIENGQHSFITPGQIKSYKKLLDNNTLLINKFFNKKNEIYTYNPQMVEFVKINQNSKYSIANNSVDLIYSCAVLEHVHNLELCFQEMTRVLELGGIMNHQVDLRDHVFSQKKLWFLNISDFWFNALFKNTGEYVNRKRLDFYEYLANKHNLKITNLEKNIIFKEAIPKNLIKKYPNKDLQTLSFNMVLIKKQCAE